MCNWINTTFGFFTLSIQNYYNGQLAIHKMSLAKGQAWKRIKRGNQEPAIVGVYLFPGQRESDPLQGVYWCRRLAQDVSQSEARK